ncbi:MAG: zf-HC2 domain-containing protein [Phycisphaerales bacterium]
MVRYDCLDFKVNLSAYLDGEIDAAHRSDADRHLLECRDCRTLLEQAERNDAAIRAICARDGAFLDETSEAMPLPAGFEDAVLDRTRLRRHVQLRRVYRSVGGSFGLLAAAAALALGAALYFVTRAGRNLANEGPSNSNLVSDEDWEHLGSDVHGPPQPPRRLAQSDKPRAVIPLTDAESQAIHGAATTLAAIIVTPFEDVTARERLRQIVRYDELNERLGSLRSKLDPSGRRQLDAARATLFQLVRDRPELELWNQLQEDLRLMELPAILEAITAQNDVRDSA